MRIFISEYLTCGAWGEEEMPASLLKEGTSMLSAISWDFAQNSDYRVTMTWDQRLGDCPPGVAEMANIDVYPVKNTEEESQAFDELCRAAEVALIIAPEFQDLLAQRCQRVRELGTTSLNCSASAIRQCGDKLELARKLEALGVPTIPTQELRDPAQFPTQELKFPVVVKPRDGAGSQNTFLISSAAEWRDRWRIMGQNENTRAADWIVQPYIPGHALSIAGIVGNPAWSEDRWMELFPLAEQEIAKDGRFGFLGGSVPGPFGFQHEATQLARAITQHLPGLVGYVGWDFLVPRTNPEELLLVEINPRLTTSYLGYRELADQNLAEYILPWHCPDEPLRWKSHTVHFTASGTISIERKRGK